MFTILTTIERETACEWIATIARFREGQLMRQGHRVTVSIGQAVIDLLERQNGPSTRIAISRGRFDERNECYQPRGKDGKQTRVYHESFGDSHDTGRINETTLYDVIEALEPQERRVIELRAAGNTMQEIADKIGIAQSSMSNRFAKIIEKISGQMAESRDENAK